MVDVNKIRNGNKRKLIFKQFNYFYEIGKKALNKDKKLKDKKCT